MKEIFKKRLKLLIVSKRKEHFQINIGFLYIGKGEYDRAIEYLKPSLSLAEKINDIMGIALSISFLIIVYLEKDALEEVQKYLNRLKKIEIQMKMKVLTDVYMLDKAVFLIKTGGSRNRGEA